MACATLGRVVKLLPASFEGHFVRLRPVARQDHLTIFAQRISFEFFGFDHRAVAVPDFDRWEGQELPEMLQGGPVLVVEDKQGTYLGLVRAYRIDGRDRRGFLDLRLSLEQGGPTAETILATLDYLFTFVNLRKVYIESVTISEPIMQWLEKAGFAEEVRLRDYVWRGRDYSDLVYYGLHRDVWAVRRQNLENSLLISAAVNQQLTTAQ